MIVILAALAGAVVGAAVAYRRRGRPADILQYAFVHALIFALLGLFLTLILHRAGL